MPIAGERVDERFVALKSWRDQGELPARKGRRTPIPQQGGAATPPPPLPSIRAGSLGSLGPWPRARTGRARPFDPVGRGEHPDEQHTIFRAKEDRSFRFRRIHDRAKVVHPMLERQ